MESIGFQGNVEVIGLPSGCAKKRKVLFRLAYGWSYLVLFVV
jgi:hypothetical protein